MRTVPNRSVSDSVLTLLQLLTALLCGYVTTYSITDGDIFWHLAAGREIIARRAILFTDPFAYTLPAQPWIDVHWLFQVIVYLFERTGGLRLLLAVKMAVVSGAVFLLFCAFRKNTGTLFVWLATVGIFFLQRYLVPMRPVVATLFFIGAEIALFERYCVSGKRRLLAGVAVVQLLWVNTQGLFPLGIVIGGAYALGELIDRYIAIRRSPEETGGKLLDGRYGTLAVVPAGLLLVSLINPYGWRALRFAFGLFIRLNPVEANPYSRTIVENMPFPAMIGTRYMPYVVAVFMLLVLYVLSVVSNRKKVRMTHLLLVAVGMLLAWMAQRNGILFTMFALPGLLWNFGNGVFTGRRTVRVAGVAAALTLAAGGAFYATVNHTRLLLMWPHTLSPFSHPVESASQLWQTPPEGNLFNADRYGGYLLWKLYPREKVSHDTRLTMRPGSFYREYLAITEHPERFAAFAVKWNVTHVVLPVAPLELYLPLASSLYRDSTWRLIHTDGAEVLFTSDTAAGKAIDLNRLPTVDKLLERLRNRYGKSSSVRDEAVVWLGRWCLAAGAYDGARRVLRSCGNGYAKILLSVAEEQAGAAGEAERVLRAACADNRRDPAARLALAKLCLRQGDYTEGVHQLEILLKQDPFNKQARNILYTLTIHKKEAQ